MGVVRGIYIRISKCHKGGGMCRMYRGVVFGRVY